MKNRLNAISVMISVTTIFLFSLTACAQKQAQLSGASKKTKNVIMIVGDGMGPEQVGLLLTYAKQAPHSVIADKKTCFDRIMAEGGALGLAMTNPKEGLIVDSAAAGSQMATGKYSGSEMMGLNYKGDPVQTVLEFAVKAGKSTGLVTDTRLTHATPAAFSSHQAHRTMENAIAVDMLNAGSTVMLGGGLRYWIPKEANTKESAVRKELIEMSDGAVRIKSKRKDDRNLVKEAHEKGYAVAFTKEQMEAANGKLLGLFTYSSMPGALKVFNSLDDENRTIPTLKEMSAKAIDVLSQNDKGFFLMIEAGQIDWAAHQNDAGLMLHEMLILNETVNYVLDWAKDRDDTLIVVTADHTTGGFGFSYTGKDLPKPKALPGEMFKDRDYKPNYNFGDPKVLDKLYAQKLSYEDIFSKFDGLEKNDQTPENLVKLVSEYTAFPITVEQADRILQTEDNPIYEEGHAYMGTKVVPKLDNKDEFYIYQHWANRSVLLALAVGADQFVVWSTGAHTSTPVLVFSKGTHAAMAPFSKLIHHTQMGQYCIDAITDQ